MCRGAGGLCGGLRGGALVARKSCPAKSAIPAAAAPARARSSVPALGAGAARSRLPGGGIPGLGGPARARSAGVVPHRASAGVALPQRKSVGAVGAGAAAAPKQQAAPKARLQSDVAAPRKPLGETQPKAAANAGAASEKRKREPSAPKAPPAEEAVKHVRVEDACNSDDDFA